LLNGLHLLPVIADSCWGDSNATVTAWVLEQGVSRTRAPPGFAQFVGECGNSSMLVRLSRSVLHRMTEMILPWLNAPTRFSELFLDRYCLLLCTHVTKAYGSSTVRIKVYRGSLAPWQNRPVMELLAECLDGSLRLRTPAEECELSISHFARSFRRTFKRSAHQYLILKRIEKAKRCFDLDVRPFRAVLQAGLSDQAAFSRTFKAVVGTSPRQWRREACHRDCQLSCRPSGAILCRRVVLKIQETALHGNCDRMSAVVCIELGKNAFEVILDGVLRNVEIRCDDLVRAAVRNSAEGCDLSRSHQVVSGVLGDHVGNFAGNSFSAAMNQPNCFHQLSPKQILQQVSDGSSLESLEGLHIARRGREDDDSRLRKFPPNRRDRCEAVHLTFRSAVGDGRVAPVFDSQVFRAGSF